MQRRHLDIPLHDCQLISLPSHPSHADTFSHFERRILALRSAYMVSMLPPTPLQSALQQTDKARNLSRFVKDHIGNGWFELDERLGTEIRDLATILVDATDLLAGLEPREIGRLMVYRLSDKSKDDVADAGHSATRPKYLLEAADRISRDIISTLPSIFTENGNDLPALTPTNSTTSIHANPIHVDATQSQDAERTRNFDARHVVTESRVPRHVLPLPGYNVDRTIKGFENAN